MLDEFQKSIKAVLYDRLTSPLAGCFIFSWFVWNWGLVYYVLIGVIIVLLLLLMLKKKKNVLDVNIKIQ